MIGHGVCSFSSHSCSAGRTTSAAKPCTQSRMSFWSCVSSSENVTSCPAAPEIASTAASAAAVADALEADETAVGDADIGRDLLWGVTGGALGNDGWTGTAATLDRPRRATLDRVAEKAPLLPAGCTGARPQRYPCRRRPKHVREIVAT